MIQIDRKGADPVILSGEHALDIPTAVLELVDHQFQVRYANPSYRNAYAASSQKIGISMEHLLGQKISRHLTGQQRDISPGGFVLSYLRCSYLTPSSAGGVAGF